MNNIHRFVHAAFVLCGGWATGCSDTGNDAEVSLAELENLRISVSINQQKPDEATGAVRAFDSPPPPRGVVMVARLQFDNQPAEGDCWVVRGLEAKLDTTAVEASPGGWAYGETDYEGEQDKVCHPPKVIVRLDDLGAGFDRSSVTLRVRDAERSLTVLLGDLLVERTAELVAPPASGYRSGDELRLRWQPASDLDLRVPHLQYEPIAAAERGTIDPSAVTRQGDTLAFRLPSPLAPAERRTLRALLSQTLVCNVHNCTVEAAYLVPTTFRVVAP